MAGGATANATATTTGSGAIRVDLVQATRRVALNSATEVTEVSLDGTPDLLSPPPPGSVLFND